MALRVYVRMFFLCLDKKALTCTTCLYLYIYMCDDNSGDGNGINTLSVHVYGSVFFFLGGGRAGQALIKTPKGKARNTHIHIFFLALHFFSRFVCTSINLSVRARAHVQAYTCMCESE